MNPKYIRAGNAIYAGTSSRAVRGVMRCRVVSFARRAAMRILSPQIKQFLACSLVVISLGAAGSEGPWFPYPNIIGTIVFAVIVFSIGRVRRGPCNHS